LVFEAIPVAAALLASSVDRVRTYGARAPRTREGVGIVPVHRRARRFLPVSGVGGKKLNRRDALRRHLREVPRPYMTPGRVAVVVGGPFLLYL